MSTSVQSGGGRNTGGGKPPYDPLQHGARRKIPMACTFCRHRKLKCDGMRPQCKNCKTRGYPCFYVPV
ncbi:hypothetical protein DFH07DRAFT_965935 [Mycena maculata]|uniref:Zn(2)-C6 fungal-type domain-containing protein n=1 Tax=Mycena maculata TaxID=230809 RepID=A0AAD7IAS2_9AGAR|nr:hypothetical protein DFH07DRAFT_965935 [Mycena maculata]